MKQVRITNMKTGPIVINSLKIVLAPGKFLIKDEIILDDSEIKELIGAKMVKVEDASRPLPKSKPVAKEPGSDKPQVAKQDTKGKQKGKPSGKTAAKKPAINDEMGRNVVIMDRGEAKRAQMQSGVHDSAPRDARPIDTGGNSVEEGEDDKLGDQFVTMNK